VYWPAESAGERRRAAHVAALLAVSALLVPAGWGSLTASRGFAGTEAKLTSTEASTLSAVNKVRLEHGLPPVVVDQRLVLAARAHSADMVAGQYFDHGAFADRLMSFGAKGPRVGEDLGWAAGPDPIATIVADWLQSPLHRAVLLRAGFRRIGVGVRVGPFQGYPNVAVVTADFEGT
jgi:uncharacterized protein YkwD